MLTLVDEHGANRIGECRDSPAMQGGHIEAPVILRRLDNESSNCLTSRCVAFGSRVHIAASNAFPITDRASDEKTPSPT